MASHEVGDVTAAARPCARLSRAASAAVLKCAWLVVLSGAGCLPVMRPLGLAGAVADDVRPAAAPAAEGVAHLPTGPAGMVLPAGCAGSVLAHECCHEHHVACVAQSSPFAVPRQALWSVAHCAVGCSGAEGVDVLPLCQHEGLQPVPCCC